jgi:predicted enzyme related to lactoylglutathione lyase
VSRTIQVTFDAGHPERLMRFWCEVLEYQLEPLQPAAETGLRAAGLDPARSGEMFAAAVDPGGQGPRLLALAVPETKQAKNRQHLDVRVSGGPEGVAAEVERLVGLGATHQHTRTEHGSHWATLTDPEGNEFCLTG